MAEAIAPSAGLTWEEVCKDPNLRDLPYKIETNEWGQIVMSPAYQKHGAYQAEVAGLLRDRGGRIVTESAVKTTKGTKVPDVAYYSAERWEQVKDEFDASIAPEICVEVLSPSNTADEIEEKKRLYFDAGAEEVWTCDTEGRMHFFMPDGKQETSARVPGFPKAVVL